MTKKVSTIFITDTLLRETCELLASFAAAGPSEGIVYWFGLDACERSVVTTLIVPQAETDWGCVSTTAQANAEVLRYMVGTPLVLIGQAHSHPRHLVRHSDIDDRQTFGRFEGAISVVVPHFGRNGVELRHCGTHRFIDGQYRFVSPKNVNDHLKVIPGSIDLRSSRS